MDFRPRNLSFFSVASTVICGICQDVKTWTDNRSDGIHTRNKLTLCNLHQKIWQQISWCTWRTFVEGLLYISDWCTVCKDWIKPWMLHQAWIGLPPADLWPISKCVLAFVCLRLCCFLYNVVCVCKTWGGGYVTTWEWWDLVNKKALCGVNKCGYNSYWYRSIYSSAETLFAESCVPHSWLV